MFRGPLVEEIWMTESLSEACVHLMGVFEFVTGSIMTLHSMLTTEFHNWHPPNIFICSPDVSSFNFTALTFNWFQLYHAWLQGQGLIKKAFKMNHRLKHWSLNINGLVANGFDPYGAEPQGPWEETERVREGWGMNRVVLGQKGCWGSRPSGTDADLVKAPVDFWFMREKADNSFRGTLYYQHSTDINMSGPNGWFYVWLLSYGAMLL